MPFSAYATTLIFPVFAALGLWFGGIWTWLLPVQTFILIPLLELVVKPLGYNRTAEEEAAARSYKMFDWLIYGFVALQWTLVLLLVFQFSVGAYATWWEMAGAVFTIGICCGTFGINVGHELGHRRTKFEQRLAKAALTSSLYAHFYIEHNRGHHRYVATDDDVVSAPRDRTLYQHWLMAAPGTWMASWNLEKTRLAKKGRSPWTLDNEHIQLQLIQVAVVAAMALYSPVGALAFVAAAVIGFMLLETVNYVEHYGLRRQKIDGRWEKVLPKHSWNSDHPIGRAILFEVSRHSDHHANPGRPYSAMRSFPDAPQFPTGYPGMIVLSVCPPLFFKVMNPLLDEWQQKAEIEAQAA